MYIANEFSPEKCAIVAIDQGKILNNNGIEIPKGQTIRDIRLDNIKCGQVENMFSKEYIQSVRKLLKSKLLVEMLSKPSILGYDTLLK